MNYLAHLFLSGDNSEIIVGNMLEDYITGNIENVRNKHLSARLKLGIKLHRIIDTFTDSHLNVKNCKTIFYQRFGKYSPIIVDVLFDHFLIKNWHVFTSEKFLHFRQRMYEALQTNVEIQPEAMKIMTQSMIFHDWLKNYSEIWGLERAFEGLNKKINKENLDLRLSIIEFQANYEYLEEQFLMFFKDLKQTCDDFLSINILNGK